MQSFPEHGLSLFKSEDYWTCKELIEISNNGKIYPEEKLQRKTNNLFNLTLDVLADKKLKWEHIGRKTPRQILKQAFKE